MDSHIDQFLEYLYVVEENSTELTTSQVQKLETIQSKVTEIVKKVETYASSIAQSYRNHEEPVKVKAQELELAIRENSILRFSDFEEINEKIAHRGKKWVVLNKKGDKVLGTHSSREKAVKQLQAIEISKARHAR